MTNSQKKFAKEKEVKTRINYEKGKRSQVYRRLKN